MVIQVLDQSKKALNNERHLVLPRLFAAAYLDLSHSTRKKNRTQENLGPVIDCTVKMAGPKQKINPVLDPLF